MPVLFCLISSRKQWSVPYYLASQPGALLGPSFVYAAGKLRRHLVPLDLCGFSQPATRALSLGFACETVLRYTFREGAERHD